VDQYLRSQPEPLGKHPERWSPRSPSSCSDEADHQLHVELQRQFEEEDRQLRTQLEDLKTQVPLTFDCGICLSTEAEFMIFRFEPCGHAFCRDCVRGFVQSKIVEHRFPIVCPTCAIAKDVLHPGSTCYDLKREYMLNISLLAINSSLAEGIGLSQEQFALLSELELSTFSVLVHCRK
jgi:bacterioferritin-associated ferredoxin